uniref:transmembrane protein 150C isoform X2 n=1 Tax=Doryrhamphus excisus TaxID=161450 RepID=UPI0025ADBFD1|nr:transmembrane protein 150C isoform X2 [Doryrhamphus excisus]
MLRDDTNSPKTADDTLVESTETTTRRTLSWWGLLPPFFTLSTASGLWIVYFVAVQEERIIQLTNNTWRSNGPALYPPYISIAGNFPPASCIFSEVMNLSAFVGFLTGILRYVQLKGRADMPCLNLCSLAVFSAGCFGMTLLGNFQVLTSMAIHNLGTFMAFGLGVVYCWLQSYITLKANLNGEGKKVGAVRFLMSGCITVCMILYFTLVFQQQHVHAARSQWTLVMLFLVFIGTFAVEFRHGCFYLLCTESPSSHN